MYTARSMTTFARKRDRDEVAFFISSVRSSLVKVYPRRVAQQRSIKDREGPLHTPHTHTHFAVTYVLYDRKSD